MPLGYPRMKIWRKFRLKIGQKIWREKRVFHDTYVPKECTKSDATYFGTTFLAHSKALEFLIDAISYSLFLYSLAIPAASDVRGRWWKTNRNSRARALVLALEHERRWTLIWMGLDWDVAWITLLYIFGHKEMKILESYCLRNFLS